MLVLSRQRDETIMIGDNVEITVVDIRGDKVRLGITAPREIQVHRKEVYDAIKRENQSAAKLEPQDVSNAVHRKDDDTRSRPTSSRAGAGSRNAESVDPDLGKSKKSNGDRSDHAENNQSEKTEQS